MDIKLKYNGLTVNDDVKYTSLVLYDRLGGLFDNILIILTFEDKSKALSGVAKGDTISITTEDFTSGLMYVDDYSIDRNTLIINAISYNQEKKEPKSKIWRDVKLSEIISDVGRKNNLTVKTYGIADYIYKSVSQINETDMQMLDRVCKREGYSIKIDDSSLIVFNEKELENNIDTYIEIKKGDESISYISFQNSSQCKRSCTVSYYDVDKGLLTYTATDENISGGTLRINEFVNDIEEAKRFAYGYLRNNNKLSKIANITMSYNPKISAGTIFNVIDYAEFDGKYIAYEVAHDVISKKTKVKIRKVLENY